MEQFFLGFPVFHKVELHIISTALRIEGLSGQVASEIDGEGLRTSLFAPKAEAQPRRHLAEARRMRSAHHSLACGGRLK